jgi:cation diffusion facilitator CzcD-associated flavoprotein CzcO
MTQRIDVAILGAGPYGLAAGAHLHQVAGLDVQVFGDPMEFWKAQMPTGMFLRSPWSASHISDPASQFTLGNYRSLLGREIPAPIPLDDFVGYGLWFQQNTVPGIMRQKVTSIQSDSSGFQLTLDNGTRWSARRLVIAGGIKPFARRPEQFAGLFPQFVTHSSDQRDVNQFQGKRVAVIGAGQSALESAALIFEAGAEVEVLVRESNIHWLGWRAKLQKLGPISRLLYAPTDVGPAGVSRIVSIPNSVKYFPRSVQNWFRTRSLRPAGSRWLFERLKAVPIRTDCVVTSTKPTGEKLHLKLNDGGAREVDHVVLGTGYQIDISRYSFLSPELVQSIQRVNGFPKLNSGFETSVSGLHFLGAPSSWNFGPLMYFVAGTEFAARTLAGHVSRGMRKS